MIKCLEKLNSLSNSSVTCRINSRLLLCGRKALLNPLIMIVLISFSFRLKLLIAISYSLDKDVLEIRRLSVFNVTLTFSSIKYLKGCLDIDETVLVCILDVRHISNGIR